MGRGILKVSARSPFSSPLLQYIHCSPPPPPPLKNPREPLRRREAMVLVLAVNSIKVQLGTFVNME